MTSVLDGHPEIQMQWASDVSFDGRRLEVVTYDRLIEFDVSVPDKGALTVNAFSKEAPADFVMKAIKVAIAQRSAAVD